MPCDRGRRQEVATPQLYVCTYIHMIYIYICICIHTYVWWDRSRSLSASVERDAERWRLRPLDLAIQKQSKGAAIPSYIQHISLRKRERLRSHHTYVCIHIYRRLGEDVRQDPPIGKLFCLACLHARTHARTHAHSTVRSVWVCQLVRSVCPFAFSVLRVFSVFLNLLVDTLCLFYECLEDFA